ncbi:MAG: hypothetical protein OFPII_17610 [Osedax symbiont Rs1]|nr:MAG: hypothetical protein OFPII_17610 [Osedax symbiont Rs1]
MVLFESRNLSYKRYFKSRISLGVAIVIIDIFVAAGRLQYFSYI